MLLKASSSSTVEDEMLGKGYTGKDCTSQCQCSLAEANGKSGRQLCRSHCDPLRPAVSGLNHNFHDELEKSDGEEVDMRMELRIAALCG